jgi:hypothetical protein
MPPITEWRKAGESLYPDIRLTLKGAMFTYVLGFTGECCLEQSIPASGWIKVRPGMRRPLPFRSYLLPLRQYFACPNVLNQYIFDCYASSPPSVGLWSNTNPKYSLPGWFISGK